jgi:intracellular sulfur oxidation DsrE/DsrF family protein
MSAAEERKYEQMINEIGNLIEDTIPDPSEISVVDAVRLLVRENNALRKVIGLQTYRKIAQEEGR